MKRVWAKILIFAVIMTLAACNGETPQTAESSTVAGNDGGAAVSGSNAGSAESAGDDTPEGYHWNEFQQMEAGEYFKGVLFKSDYQSRAGIDKGLPADQKSDVRIGIVAAALANPYFVHLTQAAEDRAKEYGYNVSSVSYDQETSKMVAAIEDYVTLGVDAIILDPMDMNSASLSCAYAAEHGVLVVAVGQPMPSDSSVLTSIYPAYYEVAFENGAAVARDCFDIKTKIVAGYIMIVPTWHTWGNGYIAGLYYTRMEQLGTPVTKEEAMIKGYEYYLEFFDKGSVEIPEANMEFAGYIGDGGQDQTGAMAATESLLTAIPDLNLLLPINDFQAAGGVMALENNGLTPGKDVIVVASNDGSTEALENIRDGKLYATSNSAPELMGASAVDLLHMIFAEDYDANDLLAQTLMPVINLNSSNWEEYYVQDSVFAKKPSQPVVFKTTREAFSEFLAAQ